MSEAIIQALRRKYMENIGNPAAQLIGGGVRGYLGLDAPEYADGLGMEAYRHAAALSNTPVVGMPSMAVRAGTKAAPAVVEALRRHGKGFQEYNRALGPAGASQAIVWHGSPHKFDKFDASKIGTGEGAQAYGHGLYFAEAPDVAKSYQDMARRAGPQLDGAPINTMRLSWDEDRLLNMYKNRLAAGLSHAEAIKQTSTWAKNNGINDAKSSAFLQRVTPPSEGSLYKVDLPDEKIARMLDWDKPLSQQAPEVQAALASTKNKQLRAIVDYAGAPYSTPGLEGEVKTIGEAIKLLGMNTSPAKGSQLLAKHGIPGIRYLDEGSRAKGQGTSNFVVFPGEEEALTILERNNEIINALRRR